MTDREFVAWCRKNPNQLYIQHQERLLSIAGKDSDGSMYDVGFLCELATLRLDLAEANTLRENAERERDESRLALGIAVKAIEAADHHFDCASLYRTSGKCRGADPCDCWQSTALAEIGDVPKL